MAQLQQAFNANSVKPSTPGEGQLPISGKEGHPVVIIDSEICPAKDSNNGFIKLTLEITDGPNKGQSGPYRLNIYNTSEVAVRIAYEQLSAICYVTGVMEVSDTSMLHNIPFRAVVAQQKGNDEYTEIKGVLDVAGNPPGQGQPAQQQQQQNNNNNNNNQNNGNQQQNQNNNGNDGSGGGNGWQQPNQNANQNNNQNNGNQQQNQQQQPNQQTRPSWATN